MKTLGTIRNSDDISKLIPRDLIDMYNIDTTLDDVRDMNIYEPSYINIHEPVKVVENESCVSLCNERVIVTLWKNRQIMHTTVLHK